jgi:hypothetical protein
MTECEEIAATLPLRGSSRLITMDEARAKVKLLLRDETPQVIDNIAEAYRERHNAAAAINGIASFLG